ncbi:RnfABCDGE type electron transport complex subunit D [Robertkochia sediminum]|uniref:RnfABCDGE type electron transport complex subunit D n=1 Tax=Robertkochia sediminum TaxID=2785326 RepID=UPI0019313D88|nr:RnfABCDGE type electron transport complex subunit D [Robertkochia sediminum]MBL7472199.1 RnfABCDGE type electron transport complex subunit D [Robertkochia sediminum]
MLKKTLHISSSPHITKGRSTDQIMKNVVWALLPVAGFSVWSFGWNALLVIATATLASVLTEHVLCRLSKKETTVNDYSAVITGLLLGLTLPPTFPLWMAFIGGVVGIALGKYIFGGLGYNVFNPALVARAFLQAAFPVAITTWHPALLDDRFTTIASSVFTWPFMAPQYDVISGATPLAAFKFDGVVTPTMELAFGQISGSTGETCAVIIILGGLYLIARGMMSWRIPAAVLLSAFLLSGALYMINSEVYPSPVFMLFSGGLMLGAVYMATDMVSSPITPAGLWVYGAIIGILTIVIRVWGGLSEGVMYAILLANAISPHIDRVIKNRVYGTNRKMKVA